MDKTQFVNCNFVGKFPARNRPDIRQSPVPAGYPASISGSGSGPAEEKFAGFLPENVKLFKIIFRGKFKTKLA